MVEHTFNDFLWFIIIASLTMIGATCVSILLIGYIYEGFLKVKSWWKPSVDRLNKQIAKLKDTKDISDGYHTFDELYDFRREYHAAFVNTSGFESIKSFRHADGEECFGGGWFIVQTWIPGIGQISNHYESKYWDLFRCKQQYRAQPWDGHTPNDVLNRLNIMNTYEPEQIEEDV